MSLKSRKLLMRSGRGKVVKKELFGGKSRRHRASRCACKVEIPWCFDGGDGLYCMPTSMMNLYENACLRCGRTVYQVDRIGPLKDFTFFHTGCFKCSVCSSKLTLKTYCNNQDDQDDKEVYCSSHVPKIGPGHLDGEAVGIRSALNVPKSAHFVNDQIRPGGRPSIDGDSIVLKSPYTHKGGNGSGNGSENGHNDYKYGRFDHTALHIAHALNATRIQRIYDKPINQYLSPNHRSLTQLFPLFVTPLLSSFSITVIYESGSFSRHFRPSADPLFFPLPPPSLPSPPPLSLIPPCLV
ncbi:Kyphoscoliosis peptidase [Penaeus vannamei]|uniref:Kyphoscoliosis peptidase n=1 Tax=Penaeus vannamei TaxID=6689 RepID=A0A423TTC2_PENVA|nr:Kyphoscoliosis peptidase [Penaeus vannamei]